VARTPPIKPARLVRETEPRLILMVVPFVAERLPGMLGLILLGIGDCHNGEATVNLVISILAAVARIANDHGPCPHGSSRRTEAHNRSEVSRAVPSPQEEKQAGQVPPMLAVRITGAQTDSAM
jgi:hypothetical protein